MHLGQILVAQRLVTKPTLDAAMQRQRKQGGRLGYQLVAMGALTPEQLTAALARQRDLEAAVTASARSLRTVRIQHGEMNRQTVRARQELGRAYLAAGQAADALSLSESALQEYRKAFGAEHVYTREMAKLAADARAALKA
jgi:hypothetical protein